MRAGTTNVSVTVTVDGQRRRARGSYNSGVYIDVWLGGAGGVPVDVLNVWDADTDAPAIPVTPTAARREAVKAQLREYLLDMDNGGYTEQVADQRLLNHG